MGDGRIGGKSQVTRCGAEPGASEKIRQVPRVVVCDGTSGGAEAVGVLLGDLDRGLVSCHNGEALLEAIAERRPNAVIYGLRAECDGDIGVLNLMRRMAPHVPLIVLARDDSLRIRRLVHMLRPVYFALVPVEAEELREALWAALNPRIGPVP